MSAVAGDVSPPPPSGPVAAAAEWSDHAVSLRDFATVHHAPTLIRITKGQYRNIGVAKSVQSELYLYKVETTSRVLAESVRVKRDCKRVVSVSDQKYALPLSFSGWFEVLSEAGKSAAPLASVAELARAFPHACLVRDPVKAFGASDGGQLALDRGRTVAAGDVLTLDRDMVATIATPKGVVRRRFLRCTDATGCLVFLPLEQRGAFSPVAGQTNISGMHRLAGLLTKFRLPIVVRLVHGPVPQRLRRAGFTAVFRLLSRYDDQTAFVCPLKRDAKMVPISTREPLRLVAATNMAALAATDECARYAAYCSAMVDSYLDSIHVLVTPPDAVLIARGRHELQLSQERQIALGRQPDAEIIAKEEEDVLFDEIEDIYHYVREGGIEPLPRSKPVPVAVPTKTVVVMQEVKNVKGEEPLTPELADEDYWEEPIYEQLHKLRREQAAQHRKLKQTYSLPDVSARPPAPPPPPDLIANIDSAPVANLRQMYKRIDCKTHLAAASRANAKNTDNDDLGYDEAPPVPPKHYDQSEVEAQLRSSSPEVTVTTPMRTKVASGTAKASSRMAACQEKQGLERQYSTPVTVRSNPPLAAQLSGGSRAAVAPAATPSAVSSGRQPYVAVAQVGAARSDAYNQRYTAMATRPADVATRKTTQSMYL